MKRRTVSLLLAAAVLAASLFAGQPVPARAEDGLIGLGEYLTMGEYDGTPIRWRCVAFEKVVGTDENGNPIMDSTQTVTEPTAGYLPLMLVNAYICEKEFDLPGNDTSGSHGRGSIRTEKENIFGSSNYWGDSNLRCWLNSGETTVTYTCGNPPASNNYQRGREPGFLTNFTPEELARIRPATQKTIVAKCDYDYFAAQGGVSVDGTSEFKGTDKNWSGGMSLEKALEGYEDAYCVYLTDTVFLPDMKQLENIKKNHEVLGNGYYHLTYIQGVTGIEYAWPIWIRSAGGSDAHAAQIDSYGDKIFHSPAAYEDIIVRPAFYLNEMPDEEPEPTPTPTPEPTPTPTPEPTPTPTPEPTPTPTPEPSARPSAAPSGDDDDDDDDGPYRPAPSKPAGVPASTPTPTPTATPAPTETPKPEPTPPPVSVEQFDDVPEDAWYYSSVKNAVEAGLMVGVDDGEFAPEAEITRAMFVTVLYRMAGEPKLLNGEAGRPFADVEGDSWYADAVYWARANGIVEGRSAGEYAPDQGVTREQLAVIVYRFVTWKQGDAPAGGSLPYADQDAISDYAREAVLWNTANGILQGHEDNTFDPQAGTTRAQAAAIFGRLMEALK